MVIEEDLVWVVGLLLARPVVCNVFRSAGEVGVRNTGEPVLGMNKGSLRLGRHSASSALTSGGMGIL